MTSRGLAGLTISFAASLSFSIGLLATGLSLTQPAKADPFMETSPAFPNSSEIAAVPTGATSGAGIWVASALAKPGPRNDLIQSPLGTRLSDFKQLSALDREKYPQAKVLCSGDPELRNSTSMAVMHPMADERQAGMIRCNVFKPDPVNLSWWAPILPSVNGKEVKSTNYFFLPDGKGDYRLLFVQAVLPDALLPDTRSQLTEHLGMPKKRNEPGLVSESLWTESWQTPNTWLLLDSRKDSFRHDFTLTYVSADLVDDAAARGFDEQRYPLYYSAYNHFR